jgi:molybdopterin converting factor small subunit
MQVDVRFYSNLGDLMGTRGVSVSLPDAATVADLAQRLRELYPERAALLAQAAFLIDRKGTAPATELADGAQVLLLLSLGGGRESPCSPGNLNLRAE